MGCRTVDPRRKRGRGLVQGGVLVNYENGSTTIVGKADTLRRKFKRPMSPEEGMWRVAMGHALSSGDEGEGLAPVRFDDRGTGEVCGRGGLRTDSAIALAGGQNSFRPILCQTFRLKFCETKGACISAHRSPIKERRMRPEVRALEPANEAE